MDNEQMRREFEKAWRYRYDKELHVSYHNTQQEWFNAGYKAALSSLPRITEEELADLSRCLDRAEKGLDSVDYSGFYTICNNDYVDDGSRAISEGRTLLQRLAREGRQ